MLSKNVVISSEIRYLSVTLRRLLTDNELRSIAPPRIGALRITSPDNSFIYDINKKQYIRLFVSGGCHYYSNNVRALIMGGIGHKIKLDGFDKNKAIDLPLDGFLNQKVICFENVWIKRGDVIKYVANICSGAHTAQPASEQDKLLNRVRSILKLSHESGTCIKLQFNPNAFPVHSVNEPEFKWSMGSVDCVLLELFSVAAFLCNSDDILKLSNHIKDELL